ncbi:hypothetical protein D8674_011545 [Pyrus ussuriensis x Pyrus communis]|uniref:Uncharacterized protein n=1 Tax=Pyrus ussuriensis x Pyrus communis TaxID=2448454 RepID=A0A5N5FZT7_9ROSA|nr:hypothetical protein D8674_011545 [Pyrus ussuriensis x Pyrus communis]
MGVKLDCRKELWESKMHPTNGNDASGGFKLGPNGLEPYNEDLYHTRLRNEAFIELILAPSVTHPHVIYIHSEFDDEENPVEPSESVGLCECQFDLNED